MAGPFKGGSVASEEDVVILTICASCYSCYMGMVAANVYYGYGIQGFFTKEEKRGNWHG